MLVGCRRSRRAQLARSVRSTHQAGAVSTFGGSVGTGSLGGGEASDGRGVGAAVELGDDVAELGAQVLLHAPELPHAATDLARDLGHLVRAEDEQRDDEDHDDLGGAERRHSGSFPG